MNTESRIGVVAPHEIEQSLFCRSMRFDSLNVLFLFSSLLLTAALVRSSSLTHSIDTDNMRPTPKGNTGAAGGSLLNQIMLFIASVGMIMFTYKKLGLLIAGMVAVVLLRIGFLRLITRCFSGLLSRSANGAAFSEALRRADTMSAPITEKETHRGENAQLIYGMSCMQGWRRNMEDAHTTHLAGTNSSECSIFAVFDGHCGPSIAQFCGQALPQYVESSPAYRDKDYAGALSSAFVAIDKHLVSHPTYRLDRSGCTANAIILTPDGYIHCANAGDSRCVMCRDGAAYPLSQDHKPHLPIEFQRIQQAKHFVWNRRVDGILALSRAIGDFQFKTSAHVSWEEQAVTCVPDVKSEQIDPERDSFVVLACDGIWDVMTNEQVISFVKAKLAARVEPQTICELLMQSCLSPTPFGLGCDNMSVIIIVFKPKKGGSGVTATAGAANGTSSGKGDGGK